MYVVIAFPDREFALHMFTVSVPKAAVYFFFFQWCFQLQNGKGLALSMVHTWGIMSKAQI